MAGTSSGMHKEPTEALLFMLEHDTRMVAKEKEAKKKQEEEASEMRKRIEERDRMTPAYQSGAAMREHELRLLQGKLAKMKWKNKRNRNKKMATEAGKAQAALPVRQEKLAEKKKPKNEDAGKNQDSVTEAEESVADMISAGGNERREEKTKAMIESLDKSLEKEKSIDKSLKKENRSQNKTKIKVTQDEESVTQATKAAQHAVRVFEGAQILGAKFQSFWERLFFQSSAYDENTTIPAMCFTHDTDAMVRTRDTLQVVSVKVASIKKGLRWPLEVFGTVSARDVVDRKRNIIFHRERDNCQTITEQDPYLMLTGPSRAVVIDYDPSYIEVVLKVKGATESKDKELSRLAVAYRLGCLINGLYPSKLSTLELTFSQVYRSVEATVNVKVTGGSWPDGFKGVFSAATVETECAKVRLLDVGDDGLMVDAADGMIRLSRRVVSVEMSGMLKVFVSACSADGEEEELCEASFVPEKAGVSSGIELKIGSCRMEATVAWSLFHDWYYG